MSHLHKFGIGFLEILDGFQRKGLVALRVDHADDFFARLRRYSWKRIHQGPPDVRIRLSGEKAIEHTESDHDLRSFTYVRSAFGRHVEKLGIISPKL